MYVYGEITEAWIISIFNEQILLNYSDSQKGKEVAGVWAVKNWSLFIMK